MAKVIEINGSTYNVTSNGHPRNFISLGDLTDKEKEIVSWTDESDYFFRYRNSIYSLSEFETTYGTPGYKDMREMGFDGVCSETVFSCVAIRLDRNDPEMFTVSHVYV